MNVFKKPKNKPILKYKNCIIENFKSRQRQCEVEEHKWQSFDFDYEPNWE